MKKPLVIVLLIVLAMTPTWSRVIPILSVQPSFSYNGYPLLSSVTGEVKGKEVDGWYENYQDLYRRYFDETSLMDLGIKIDDEHFGLVFNLDIRRAFDTYFTSTSYSNIPFVGNSMDAILDLNFPRVGFVEVKFNKFYASIGRRQIKWGPSDYSMAINNSAPFMDNAWFSYATPAGNGEFWYNFIVSGFSSNVFNETPGKGLKTLFAHRMGWGNDFFRAGFGELNMVYDEMPNLMDFTPLGIWHNLYQDKKSNVMLVLDLEGMIPMGNFGKLRIYGEFVMDDFDLPHEISNPNGKPAAMGFNAGMQYHILDSQSREISELDYHDYVKREKNLKFTDGLNITYEWYFTTPYLYNRDRDTGKFTIPIRTFTFGQGYIDDINAFFIGFPYGPNTMLHRINVKYDCRTWSVFATAEFLIRGSYDIDSPFGSADVPDYMDYRFKLRGDITKTIILDIGADWSWKPGFTVKGAMSGGFDLTHNKKALAVTLGLSMDVPGFAASFK